MFIMLCAIVDFESKYLPLLYILGTSTRCEQNCHKDCHAVGIVHGKYRHVMDCEMECKKISCELWGR